jgi:hypothetical protein
MSSKSWREIFRHRRVLSGHKSRFIIRGISYRKISWIFWLIIEIEKLVVLKRKSGLIYAD